MNPTKSTLEVALCEEERLMEQDLARSNQLKKKCLNETKQFSHLLTISIFDLESQGFLEQINNAPTNRKSHALSRGVLLDKSTQEDSCHISLVQLDLEQIKYIIHPTFLDQTKMQVNI